MCEQEPGWEDLFLSSWRSVGADKWDPGPESGYNGAIKDDNMRMFRQDDATVRPAHGAGAMSGRLFHLCPLVVPL